MAVQQLEACWKALETAGSCWTQLEAVFALCRRPSVAPPKTARFACSRRPVPENMRLLERGALAGELRDRAAPAIRACALC
eukprot:704395-Alexandrium_andersonii.AAC.1